MAAGLTDQTDPRLPRCCPAHQSWPQLTEHLIAEFPAVPREDVLSTLVLASNAVQFMQLDESDAIDVVELIVRNRLLMRLGQISPLARLDRVRRPRRTAMAASG